jgi:hypothetical protein
VQRFTDRLWALAGGPGRPPRWLADSFGLLESLFTYQALRLDFDRTETDVVEVTCRLMTGALHAALADARRPPHDGAGREPRAGSR